MAAPANGARYWLEAESEADAATTTVPPDSGPAAPTPSDTGVRKVEHAEAQPIDLIDTAGAPIAKRLVPVLGVVVVVVLLVRWRRHRS